MKVTKSTYYEFETARRCTGKSLREQLDKVHDDATFSYVDMDMPGKLVWRFVLNENET